jgi:hypothetical protein
VGEKTDREEKVSEKKNRTGPTPKSGGRYQNIKMKRKKLWPL